MKLRTGVLGMALAVLMLAPAAMATETSHPAGVQRPATPVATPSAATTQNAATPSAKNDGEGRVLDSPPQVIVTNPPPVPLSWTLHERILWGAQLVLVILAYAGIMLVISLLKKIERQTRYAETAAEAAATSAQAALLHAQAVMHAERPWLLITAEPLPCEENSFRVMATNRGRAPARVVTTTVRTLIAVDEEHLPASPEYTDKTAEEPLIPLILLPGESTLIKTFCRGDVRVFCNSEEEFKRLENWEEKLFLLGKIVYRNLAAPAGDPLHETNWCCWHIHGRRNSGLVVAGPAAYNMHT